MREGEARLGQFKKEKENGPGPVLSLENAFPFQIFYKMQMHLNTNPI
jgi:hypothetical protein